MKGILPKQCYKCRSRIIIEDNVEVKEKIKDGRRWLTFKCVVCNIENTISNEYIVPKKIRNFKLDK